MQGNKKVYIQITIRELEAKAEEYYQLAAYFRDRLTEAGGRQDKKVNRDMEQYFNGALAAVDYIKRTLEDDLIHCDE